MKGDHCCEMMMRATQPCEQHREAPFACTDALIAHFEDGTYGIIYHDGGSLVSMISFCPYCGTKLAEADQFEDG